MPSLPESGFLPFPSSWSNLTRVPGHRRESGAILDFQLRRSGSQAPPMPPNPHIHRYGGWLSALQSLSVGSGPWQTGHGGFLSLASSSSWQIRIDFLQLNITVDTASSTVGFWQAVCFPDSVSVAWDRGHGWALRVVFFSHQIPYTGGIIVGCCRHDCLAGLSQQVRNQSLGFQVRTGSVNSKFLLVKN